MKKHFTSHIPAKRIMIRLMAVLLLLNLGYGRSAAQYVTIPDAVFVTWLQNNGFAQCMNGNQLDTGCNAVKNATQLWPAQVNIQSLEGVQYFPNLQILGCHGDQVSYLPNLPVTLLELDCDNNNLASLPILPPHLQTLWCYQNGISSLPALPASLKDLECETNNISALPTLPDSLNYLECGYNNLTSLPVLPATLNHLICDGNGILSSLPALPDSMYELVCMNNPALTCLPYINRIVNLSFYNTAITCLPDYGNVTGSTPALNTVPLCTTGNTNGCAAAVLTAFAGNDTTICAGASVILGANPGAGGGTGPYQYAWSGGGTTFNIAHPTVSPTVTTTYTLTVTDLTSTIATDTVTINVAAGFTVSTSPTAVCNGNNGSACALPFGGMAPYTYVWSTNNTNACITGLAAGSYAVTVTDASAGCTASAVATVNAVQGFTFSNTVTEATCNQCNGQIIISITGGSGPFTYQYNDSLACNSGTCSSLCAGTYTAQVTDANGCSLADTIYVTTPSGLFIDSISTKNSSCNGSNNGTACAFVTGGTLPYKYLWSPGGATSSCINGLSAGVLAVTVTDQNGAGCSVSGTCSVTQPAALTAPVISATNVSCNGGNNGTITIDTLPTGGTPPYHYSINGGAYQSSRSFIALAPNTYAVTAEDANDCTVGSNSVTIIQPAALTAPVISATNITCSGGDNGTVTVDTLPTGGTPPYQYSLNAGGWQSGISFSGLSPNSYTVLARDTNGCNISSNSVTITQPPAIIISDSTINATCGQCNGGVTISVSGGTGTFTYQYINAPGCSLPTCTSMCPGAYGIAVTDANGCEASDSFNIQAQPGLNIDSATTVNVTCNGFTNGSACVFVSGGTSQYKYLWSPGADTMACIQGLSAGSYSVSVTDAGLTGCSATATVTISQPAVLFSSASTVNASCGLCNGTVVLSASGGVPPYEFTSYLNAVPRCDATFCDSLCTGAYNAIVTDVEGCVATDSFEIASTPGVSIDSIVTVNVSCFGGQSGSACVYTSSPGIVYYLWSPDDTSACIEHLAAGVYEVTVTDTIGCTATSSCTISQPAQLVSQILSSNQSSTPPDSLDLSVSGGTVPYIISWNDGTVDTTSSGTDEHGYNSAGDFTIQITDAKGCSSADTFFTCIGTCVWPGDANYDGTVDNTDLLAIGLGYDSTGYGRADTSISWYAHYCEDWPDTFLGGTNFKHADCDGNGIINGDDTAAILANYSLVHLRGGPGQVWRDGAPVLYVKMAPDTLYDSSTVTATLFLGDTGTLASNVYGLAFTFNFDKKAVDTSSVNLSFTNSWLFGTGDHIAINKAFGSDGQLQGAATRIDHATRSGSGAVATVTMKITTGNINGKDFSYYNFRCFISNLVVIDNKGNIMQFNEGSDSAAIAYIPTAINPVERKDNIIKIFPNPAFDKLAISSTQEVIEEIQVYDLVGNMVSNLPAVNTNYKVLDVSKLSAGTYMIHVIAGKQNYYERLVKVN